MAASARYEPGYASISPWSIKHGLSKSLSRSHRIRAFSVLPSTKRPPGMTARPSRSFSSRSHPPGPAADRRIGRRRSLIAWIVGMPVLEYAVRPACLKRSGMLAAYSSSSRVMRSKLYVMKGIAFARQTRLRAVSHTVRSSVDARKALQVCNSCCQPLSRVFARRRPHLPDCDDALGRQQRQNQDA